MDNLIETLQRIAEECTAAAGALDEPQVVSAIQRLVNACDQLGQAWSGSWIGYQALVYKDGFLPRQAGDHFDAEWGFSDPFSNACRGNWREYTSDDVQKEIYRRAGGDPSEGLAEISNKATGAFEDCRDRLLPVIEALMAEKPDPFIAQKRDDISKLRGRKIARQNVVHEIGLFQGRHGWERAIVLLEDGCEEFSNLHGITQIRFPKGDIMAKSEEIRRVLKREGYLK